MFLFWLDRDGNKLKRFLDGVIAVGGVIGAVLAIILGAQMDESIAAANSKAEASEKQCLANAADLAAAHAELQRLKPKPFKIRLRETLSQIDPNILESLAQGQRGRRIKLPEIPTNDLKKLSEEPDGRRLMVVEEGPDGSFGFGPAGAGITHDVLLTLDPAILVDDPPPDAK